MTKVTITLSKRCQQASERLAAVALMLSTHDLPTLRWNDGGSGDAQDAQGQELQ